jgi:NAD(P)-dependent dehydrogenase (short-subunit alcohol dehydrogenase family)
MRNGSGKRVVLITGASSGIGLATARLLAEKGLAVFGTSRDPSRADSPPGIEMLPLDVRADESVTACVDALLKRTARLDVLVNNAGYVQRGAVEEVSLEEAKAQFETNFFGAVRMVKAVLPIMRAQGGGRIINISSMAGLIPLPFTAFYGSSKFAMEGYTEALRHEVKPFKIHVSLVEPGFIKTNLQQNAREPAHRVGEYHPWRQRVLEERRSREERAPGPGKVAACVLRVIENPSPRLRYMVGREARFVRLRAVLPEPLFEWGMRRRFRLDVKG